MSNDEWARQRKDNHVSARDSSVSFIPCSFGPPIIARSSLYGGMSITSFPPCPDPGLLIYCFDVTERS